MSLASIETLESLIIKEKEIITIDSYQVEVLSYLGVKTADVHHFKVRILSSDNDTESKQYGLLRVGGTNSALDRETKFRAAIGSSDFIAPILASIQVESVVINPASVISNATVDEANAMSPESLSIPVVIEDPIASLDTQVDSQNVSVAIDDLSCDDDSETPIVAEVSQSEDLKEQPYPETSTTDNDNINLNSECETAIAVEATESEDLEEEYYPETPIGDSDNAEKILILTHYPNEELTLKARLTNWLATDNFSTEDALNVAIPFCQLSLKAAKSGWFFVDWSSDLIVVDKTVQFFDLTSVYPAAEQLTAGITGHYCAPELTSAQTVEETMVSYSVGVLLYQILHGNILDLQQSHNLAIKPIPRIYQILKIVLSTFPEERFPLSQLLKLLVTTRIESKKADIEWKIASQSSLGLSLDRLQNEDNYGFRQYQSHNGSTILLAAVADGMGGMARGEEASRIAIKTVLDAPLPEEFRTPEQQNQWLLDICQQANGSIADAIKNGGTTLSIVLAVNDRLSIAHVGDSRIYLLRNGELKQLSEDHSLVGMMVANGEITEAESLVHPDRNVLLKSLGSKKNLADGYIQNLTRTVESLSIELEQGDILLLCSDGVWDLVSKPDFTKIFTSNESLDRQVKQSIEQVLAKGASDNATLLATRYSIN
jgi:PPM family protein phosphatase